MFEYISIYPSFIFKFRFTLSNFSQKDSSLSMRMALCFTHTQAIQNLYYYIQSFIKKCPGSSKIYNCSEWGLKF